jgi:hypothetical protein
LGVFSPSETPPNADLTYARTQMNDMLSEWGNRDLFIPVIGRERFTLTANKGGETNPYTIGTGGDFNTDRPSNQGSITAANLVLTATTPEVRVPLGIYTDDAYDANQLPGMSNTQPTGLYYNPTYANDLGSICLWPVPSISTNDLELFLQKSVAQFADLTTTYYVPDGLPRALKYNLADTIAGSYGRQLSASDARIAVSSLATFKRSNVKLSDALNDASFGLSSRTLYNIQTNAGGN